MKNLLLAAAVLALSAGTATANCSSYLGTGTCSQDQYGNTKITTQNLNGTYNTNTNGIYSSTTTPKLNGGYETDYGNNKKSYSTQSPVDKPKPIYNSYGVQIN